MILIYFDTSAINRLADDPGCDQLVKTLKKSAQPLVSVYTGLEILTTASAPRRKRLTSVVLQLQGKYNPLATSDVMLQRSLEAWRKGDKSVEYTVDESREHLWDYVRHPELVTEDVRKNLMRKKLRLRTTTGSSFIGEDSRCRKRYGLYGLSVRMIVTVAPQNSYDSTSKTAGLSAARFGP